jgi:hypothetical protein
MPAADRGVEEIRGTASRGLFRSRVMFSPGGFDPGRVKVAVIVLVRERQPEHHRHDEETAHYQ